MILSRSCVARRSVGAFAAILLITTIACGEQDGSLPPAPSVLDDDVTAANETPTVPMQATVATVTSTAATPTPLPVASALVDIDPVDSTLRWVVGDAGLVSVKSILPLDDVVVALASDCLGDNVEVALDRATGVELWRTDAWRPEFPDGTSWNPQSMQLGEIDGVTALLRPQSVLGVDSSDGTIRWTFVPDDGVLAGLSSSTESFVISTADSLGGPVTLQGLDPTTGTSLWSTRLDAGRFSGSFGAGADIVVVPADMALDSAMVALDASDGTIRWEVPATAGSDRGLPEIATGDVVVAENAALGVIGLDPDTGSKLWQLADGYWLAQVSSWSQENGALLRAGAVHVVSSDGVSLLDAEHGELVWTSTWDERDAYFSAGFVGTTTEGDALFRHRPPNDDVSNVGVLTLVGPSMETIWDATIDDPPDSNSELIADRSDVYLLVGCPGS